MARTVNTRGPNRGIGGQKSNRARLVQENKKEDFSRRRVVFFLMMLLDEEERKMVTRTQWQRKWLQGREVIRAHHSLFMELAV